MAAQAQSRLNGPLRHHILLALLIASWAISWPLIKLGVAAVPPIWYACLRYAIGASCLFAIVAARREAAFPPRADWPIITISGGLQMAAYSALTAGALTILPPGRASVLAFSTPIWVVPLAAWRLRERMSRKGLFGTVLGLLGVLTIAAPAFRAGDADQALAVVMLLGAALCWAIAIVAVRAYCLTATTLALAPWQMLVAAGLLFPVALGVEGTPQPVAPAGAASLAFVGPVATAFAYWAVVETGRHFRAAVLSMALLFVPILGILISTLTLDESFGASLIAGLLLIATGIRLVTLRRRPS